MKRIVILLTLTICTLLTYPSSGSAQDGVREYVIDTVQGQFRATPIGIDEMKYIGTSYISSEDSLLMRWMTWVVQKDLDFYADFERVILDSFYLRTYEITEMDLLGWQRLGADYVVRLEAEFPGDKVRAYWRLYYVRTLQSRQQIADGKFEYNRAYWREMAHDISNEVVRQLTGDPGIFRTKIAYIRKLGNAKEIFVADYDGENEKQITNTGVINLSPEFSPDGKSVFFTSYLSGQPQLYRADIATGQTEQITKFEGLVAAPSISPDGNKIACVLSKDGNSEIYVLDMKGNIIKRLTRHNSIDSAPSWSPDGRNIVFSSDRTGSPQLYIMDSDGLNMRRLTFQGGYNDSPIWSHRGERVTFVSRTPSRRFDLARIDTSGANYRVLTQVGMNENPHFAPDGKHIVFASDRLARPGEGGDIYTMDISGRNQRRITHSGNASNPTWGPLK